MRLYQMHGSGNCYKVRLAAHQLAVPLDLVEVDVMGSETRQPKFLALNPNGRVPLLELDDGRRLAESNAILFYLADGTPLLPSDRWARAQVLQWMFFEQYSHEPYVAVARFWWSFAPGGREAKRERFPEWHDKGRVALKVMDEHLTTRDFFVGTYSIADIALYAYTHVAHEGGFELGPFSALRAWLRRVAREPRHIAITAAWDPASEVL
jgi:glutathione S-transferase